MTAKHNEQKLRDLRAKIAFYRRNMADQIKTLPRYFEENGPGEALRIVINDIVKQNDDVAYCESEIQRITYERAGLSLSFPPSGPGVLPARP